MKPTKYRFPLYDLKSFNISNPVGYEQKLESFLDYIRQKGWNGRDKPDIVTNKNLLKSVAASKTNLIYVCRMKGVIFMINGQVTPAIHLEYSTAFEHILTRETSSEELDKSEIERKGVFKATVSREGGDTFRIYYSGQIDGAVKTDNGDIQHYELKTNGGKIDKYFWKNKSCSFFWQAFFANCHSLIIGLRTGEKSWGKIPCHHLYKITEVNVKEMPTRAAEIVDAEHRWTVEDGKNNLFSLLTLVRNRVTSDEDCFVFTKNSDDSSWTGKRDENGSVSEFREVIRTIICTD